jgi:hypothetical protein
MAKISRDLATPTGGVATLHPRENIVASGVFGANGAELIIPVDGCATVALDLRGTAVLTVEIQGSFDGTNWQTIPARQFNVASVSYVAAITYTVSGAWVASCAGFRLVRARVTAYTSGAPAAVLIGSSAPLDQSLIGLVTPQISTAVGAAAAAVTLTLASPGAGLRHYLTYLSIVKYAAAALTAAATPVTITTTNLPGSLAFTFPADGGVLGSIDRWREDFAFPIAAAAQNTATTIVCPVTTGVIWRVTAGFYVAP